MTDVTNIILAIRLVSSLTREVSNLVQMAQDEGRDITDDELRDLRAKSESALADWRSLD